MTVNPSDPHTFEGIGAESASQASRDDAEEQQPEFQHHDDSVPTNDPAGGNDGDMVEQARVVDLDEDDYR
ncbi:hypothetical protein [Streptomyces sp. NPDC046712]|uniref:hypothetical protein n=1 Tax=Streptomyces sp. NPDC046712 TaxID=3154802 RepID=UPI0033C247B5